MLYIDGGFNVLQNTVRARFKGTRFKGNLDIRERFSKHGPILWGYNVIRSRFKGI